MLHTLLKTYGQCLGFALYTMKGSTASTGVAEVAVLYLACLRGRVVGTC